MRRPRTTAAFACALTVCAATPTAAFQEMPVPPPSPSAAQEAKPETKPPDLALSTPPSAPAAEGGGIHVFGYTLMPKLDFGLDLLYGQGQQQLELQQGLTTFDSDVTVLGKVKRHF